MKTRETFVSNSSSSSFVLKKKNLTKSLIKWIVNDLETLATKYNIEYAGSADMWNIVQDETYIYGETTMDNLDISELFSKVPISLNDFLIESDNDGTIGKLKYTIDSAFYDKFWTPEQSKRVIWSSKSRNNFVCNGGGVFIKKTHPTINYGQTFDFIDYVDFNKTKVAIKLHGYENPDDYYVVDVESILLYESPPTWYARLSPADIMNKL